MNNLPIKIRPYRITDAPELFKAVMQSHAELSVWQPWCHATYSMNDSESWVELSVKNWENRTEFNFVIESTQTGEFLGGVGLNKIDEMNKIANLGYWVRTSHTRQGVASQAAKLAAEFGFQELGLRRIEIIAAVGNIASKRAAEKTGAKEEGILRNRLKIYENSHDAVLFSLIPDDFKM